MTGVKMFAIRVYQLSVVSNIIEWLCVWGSEPYKRLLKRILTWTTASLLSNSAAVWKSRYDTQQYWSETASLKYWPIRIVWPNAVSVTRYVVMAYTSCGHQRSTSTGCAKKRTVIDV